MEMERKILQTFPLLTSDTKMSKFVFFLREAKGVFCASQKLQMIDASKSNANNVQIEITLSHAVAVGTTNLVIEEVF